MATAAGSNSANASAQCATNSKLNLTETFKPQRRVVLKDLQHWEKEDWYQILQQEDVQFVKIQDGDDNDHNDKYVANVRILAPGITKKMAAGKLNTHLYYNDESGRFHQQNGQGVSEISAKQVKDKYKSMKEQEKIAMKRELMFKHKHNFRKDFINLSEYKKFAELLDFDLLKPKQCPHEKLLPWVMRMIEEVYDARYVHDTAELKHEDDLEEIEMRPTHHFPVFLIEHFSKRYGLRALVDQTCWDLIFNTHHFRKEFISVEIFARFMNEQYDADDLLFFLYVRSVIQKVLNISFRNIWAESTGSRHKSQQALWLSYRECALVARTVFGDEQDPMCKEFLKIVESQLVGRKRLGNMGQDTRRIEVTQVLHLAVLGYHDARPDGDDDDDDDDDDDGDDGINGQGIVGNFDKDEDEFEKKYLNHSNPYVLNNGNNNNGLHNDSSSQLNPSSLDKELNDLTGDYAIKELQEPYEEALLESFISSIDLSLLTRRDIEEISKNLVKEIRNEIYPIIQQQMQTHNLNPINSQEGISQILSAIFNDEEFIFKYRNMFFTLVNVQGNQYSG